MRHNLAVYGTLKKGGWNYPVLGDSQIFLGAGKTTHPYWMPELGQGSPVVTKFPAMAPVRVEVYEVSDSQLVGPLDYIENNGINYTREITSIDLDNGEKVEAWLYFHNRPAVFWDRGKLLDNHPVIEVFDWKDLVA